MSDQTVNPLSLWAKRSRKKGDPSAHPLICHLVDVASVAERLWEEVVPPATREWFAATIGANGKAADKTAGRWVALWAGLHDIGKASPLFRNLIERRIGNRADAPHQEVSAAVLPRLLMDSPFGLSDVLARRVATVVGGHHGAFPRSLALTKIRESNSVQSGFGIPRWDDVRGALARLLVDALGGVAAPPTGQIDNAAAMWLAGLVSVADWIGSDETLFKYEAPQGRMPETFDLSEYSARARARAAEAVRLLGWEGRGGVPRPRTFGELFPDLKEFGPNALQRAVIDLAETLPGPALVIVEAPMGEGKTEAAVFLADDAAVRHQLIGSYVALPTRATSDQMFSRVHRFLNVRFGEDRVVNLQLLHGLAALSGECAWLKKEGKRLLDPKEVDGDRGYDEAPAGVVAAEWFTAKKRGLLAPYGVGTVDQGLLAVLQTRHVFVRLFGLTGKTVVIDEVHAYDAYMSTLLERLMAWLGALRCRVVLLSATLPNRKRQELANAYAEGIGEPATPTFTKPYPRLSWVGRGFAGECDVDASELGQKMVRVRWLSPNGDDVTTDRVLGEELKTALAEGGCAAVICTTVRRAQEVYRRLSKDPFYRQDGGDGAPILGLLHARFLYEDRERRTIEALVRFGKPGGKERTPDGQELPVRRPRRAVLVATQVIEQSLDLDFDLLVTDLAPVDLVLQRIGRLHRHRGWDAQRPGGLQEPMVWIRAPRLNADGFPAFNKPTTLIYDEHVLLRSWLMLRPKDGGTLAIPDEVSGLIEDVYGAGDRLLEGANEWLRARWTTTREAYLAAVSYEEGEAESRWIKPPWFSGALWHMTEDPREEEEPSFHEVHQALTRLSDVSADVICLYRTGPRPSFDRAGTDVVRLGTTPDIELAKRLLRRSVRVTGRGVVKAVADLTPSAWRDLGLLRHHRLLEFNADDAARVGKYVFRLEEEVGLTITRVDRETA